MNPSLINGEVGRIEGVSFHPPLEPGLASWDIIYPQEMLDAERRFRMGSVFEMPFKIEVILHAMNTALEMAGDYDSRGVVHAQVLGVFDELKLKLMEEIDRIPHEHT